MIKYLFLCIFRLLACGGARVIDVKLPAKNPNAYSNLLTYLFVDNTTAPLARNLSELGIMCLNANYISDCIVLVC
jgi:hypothetical protein